MDFNEIENVTVRMLVKYVIDTCVNLDEVRDTAIYLLSYCIVQKLDEVVKNGISNDL